MQVPFRPKRCGHTEYSLTCSRETSNRVLSFQTHYPESAPSSMSKLRSSLNPVTNQQGPGPPGLATLLEQNGRQPIAPSGSPEAFFPGHAVTVGSSTQLVHGSVVRVTQK